MSDMATTKTDPLRDDLGQYAVGPDALCRCGHRKGCHLAGPKGRSLGDCIVHEVGPDGMGTGEGFEPCDCTKFRVARKR